MAEKHRELCIEYIVPDGLPNALLAEGSDLWDAVVALFESHGYKVEGGSDRPAEAQTAPDGWPEAMAGGRGTRPMDRTPDDTRPMIAPGQGDDR